MAYVIASSFACCSPILIASTIFNSLFVFLFIYFGDQLIFNLWQWKFVTADITAVFVNNQHGIQQQGQDFEKILFAISMGKTWYF